MRRFSPILLVLAMATFAFADGAKPAVLGVTEIAPGQYEVEFRVPRAGNRIPVLRPVLPDAFRTVTEPETELAPMEQITRWRVAAAPWEVAGKPIRIEGLAAAINDTLVRFRFLDGSVVSRIIMPEMPVTTFPDRAPRRGGAVVETGGFRSAVLTGIRHALTGPVHWVLLLGLALAVRLRPMLRSIAAFALAHAVGVLLPVSFPAAPAEALLALAGVVAAAHVRPTVAVVLLTGLLHGASLTGGAIPGLGMTLGIDAVQIVLGVAAVLVLRVVPAIALPRYAVGTAGVFLALVAVTETESAPRRSPDEPLLMSLIPPTAGGAPSVALGPAEDAPVRVFLAVEPVEVRVEAVLRLAALLDPGEEIAVEEQVKVKKAIAVRVREGARVQIDGKPVAWSDTRVDFVERTATGVLERPRPVPESFAEARIGVVLVFPVRSIPDEVTVDWGIAAGGTPVAVTISDPERTIALTGGKFSWRNELREPPAPTAAAVARRRPVVRTSILTIALVAAALGLFLLRRGRTAVFATVSRLGLAAAGLVVPILPVEVPMPTGGTPSDAETTSIVEALLTNVHRAFDHHDESDVYERLAVSVTGDELTTIYLEHRKNLLLAAQGGARARADAVEVTEVRHVEPVDGGGFLADVKWQVSGFVVHFGHRHFRRNVYRADVTVVPDGDAWKLRAIEIREKSRIR